MHQPNCQTSLVLFIRKLSILLAFDKCNLVRYEPSSPSAQCTSSLDEHGQSTSQKWGIKVKAYSHSPQRSADSAAGTGGRTYFDKSCLVCLVSVHKPVVCDHLKFKTGRSNGQNKRVSRDFSKIGPFSFCSSRMRKRNMCSLV